MVPDNPCESYAMLVRESMQFDIPTPSRRIEIIRELPQPAVFNAVHIITGIRRCGKTFYLFQKILYIIFDYSHKHYTFKQFEV